MKRIIIAALAVTMLTGCATRVNTEVSGFSEIGPAHQSASFQFAPLRDGQTLSAEYNSYANIIAGHLSKHGWTQSPESSLGLAEYIVSFDYGISGSRSDLYSVQTRGKVGESYYGNPIYGDTGNALHSRRVHTRFFTINIIDAKTTRSVFETIVISEGSSQTFGAVARCLFNSALADFPAPRNGDETQVMAQC